MLEHLKCRARLPALTPNDRSVMVGVPEARISGARPLLVVSDGKDPTSSRLLSFGSGRYDEVAVAFDLDVSKPASAQRSPYTVGSLEALVAPEKRKHSSECVEQQAIGRDVREEDPAFPAPFACRFPRNRSRVQHDPQEAARLQNTPNFGDASGHVGIGKGNPRHHGIENSRGEGKRLRLGADKSDMRSPGSAQGQRFTIPIQSDRGVMMRIGGEQCLARSATDIKHISIIGQFRRENMSGMRCIPRDG